METTGGCYCGALRYTVDVDPSRSFRGQCHCLPCQKIAGGSPNLFLMAPADRFTYTSGQPAEFTRSDLELPVTREFCGTCGTPILTRNPHEAPGQVVLKVGSLDDPAVYGGPRAAIHTADKREYHCIPEGVREFTRLP